MSGWACNVIEAGALGFSKERSFRYWPRTFIEGWAWVAGCACGAAAEEGAGAPVAAVLDPFASGVALVVLSWAISIRLSSSPDRPRRPGGWANTAQGVIASARAQSSVWSLSLA